MLLIITFSMFIYKAGAVFAANYVVLGDSIPGTVGFSDVRTIPDTMIPVEASLRQAHFGIVLIDSPILLSSDEFVLVLKYRMKLVWYRSTQDKVSTCIDVIGCSIY